MFAPHPLSARPLPRPFAAALRRWTLAALAVALLATALCVGLVLAPARAAAVPAAHQQTALERRVAKAVLGMLNLERKAHQLPALHMNAHLKRSARWHDVAMAKANVLSHQLPGEAPFTKRITRAGYRWHYAGENIAWNSVISRLGAVTLERLMYNELPPNDEHRLNILNPNYSDVGVDIYVDQTHHKLWLTTDFAHH
jgi:uncharacterized protein YkwD